MKCRSVPQIAAVVIRTMASVGCSSFGSGTVSRRTSPTSCHTTAFIGFPRVLVRDAGIKRRPVGSGAFASAPRICPRQPRSISPGSMCLSEASPIPVEEPMTTQDRRGLPLARAWPERPRQQTLFISGMAARCTRALRRPNARPVACCKTDPSARWLKSLDHSADWGRSPSARTDRQAAVTASSGYVQVWIVDTGQLIDLARARMTRELTDQGTPALPSRPAIQDATRRTGLPRAPAGVSRLPAYRACSCSLRYTAFRQAPGA